MSELGETFSAYKQHRKKKKVNNLQKSTRILMLNNIQFQTLSETHYRIGDFDFWPSTGQYWNRKSNRRGRGIFNLINEINKKEF